jgi:RNA polymerase sigma-70 factor, ECF subfamily
MDDSKVKLFRGFGRRHRLGRLICAERERLYRIAWSWCHDSHQADDLVQETIARALAKVDGLRDETRLRVWLTQILANLHRDLYRRVQPDTGLDLESLPGHDDPEQRADRSQLVARTRRAIGMLNEDHRQVLTLVDLAEFSYADTASILDVPVGTVMSRLSRARRRMRELCEQQGIGHAEVVPLRRPR